jgi:hypothetical protein
MTEYPRELSPQEEEWLSMLLPADRAGYAAMKQRLSGCVVVGIGRWGPGDFMLGTQPATDIDLDLPMTPVFAFGEVTGTSQHGDDTIALTLHEENADGHYEFHVVSLRSESVPDGFVERHRWTYSTWRPGDKSPASHVTMREIAIDDKAELVLGIDSGRKAILLHDACDGTNRLVPVTNYYNELVKAVGVRDASIALDHTRLFVEPERFSDDSIRQAFVSYNDLHRKVEPERVRRTASSPSRSPWQRVRSLLGGRG